MSGGGSHRRHRGGGDRETAPMQSCKRSSGPAGLGIETRGRSHVAFDETIARLDDRIPIDVVVSVPAHHGRTDRFGAYRAAVSEYTGADEAAVIVKREVPERYKSVTKAARRALREGRFAIPDDLSGLNVLIIDDVVNTGSTIGALADAAHTEGAARVLQLAFAANQSP